MNYRGFIKRVPVVLFILLTHIRTHAQEFDSKLFLQLKDSARANVQSRKYKEAVFFLQKLVEMNPLRGENWTLLAKVKYTLGNYKGAIPDFEKALGLQDGLPYYTAYYIAKAYANMGDKTMAKSWLKRSFALGFESLDEVKDDADLALLHDDKEFKQMVGDLDFKTMGRTAAWHYELTLLVREIERVLYWPYRTISKAAFAAEVRNIDKDIPHLTKNQYSVRLMALMVKLGDGHTHAFPDWHTVGNVLYLPLRFFNFSDGMYITSSDEKHKRLLGARLLEVEGLPVDTVWKKIAPICNRDNEFGLNEGVPFVLRCTQLMEGLGISKSERSVKFKVALPDGRIEQVAMESDTLNDLQDRWVDLYKTLPGKIPLYLSNMDKKFWFTELPEKKTVYFQFNQVFNERTESFSAFCKKLSDYMLEHKTEKLVIDMRWNNGGNGYLALPLLNMLLSSPVINQKGHLFVIIGRKTFSAAMITSALVERFSNAIFVGEQTGSSPNFVGEDNHFTLPYSKTDICLSTRFHQNGWGDDHRPWIAPEIYTPPSFKFYKEQRDPAMEAIEPLLK